MKNSSHENANEILKSLQDLSEKYEVNSIRGDGSTGYSTNKDLNEIDLNEKYKASVLK